MMKQVASFHSDPMHTTVEIDGLRYHADLNQPLDISIPLRSGDENVNAFYIQPVQIEPFQAGNFIGAVNQGGSCNVNNILFNPHGNGTHTECVGHIAAEPYTINQCLKKFFFIAELISVQPRSFFEDHLILWEQIGNLLGPKKPEALIIRTRPNPANKMIRHYSGTNPAYLHHDAAKAMANLGISHLLLDLPSVDREDDGGKMLAHRAFWNYPDAIREHCTITELIYVPDVIHDGTYLLNLQIASFENDASPSKPVLYKLLNG